MRRCPEGAPARRNRRPRTGLVGAGDQRQHLGVGLQVAGLDLAELLGQLGRHLGRVAGQRAQKERRRVDVQRDRALRRRDLLVERVQAGLNEDRLVLLDALVQLEENSGFGAGKRVVSEDRDTSTPLVWSGWGWVGVGVGVGGGQDSPRTHFSRLR